ncbi:hypothetical protein HPB48_021517 [Haemaphysalis longicornis]|uniref:Ionotropic receptor n=1 Tax=Haemaphysalis longicornis TaxID=44386 RepID=A0A9J6GB02_HAELO|nr:hypothetical protein HPB48_021517 [Haemaphysalis longicornis]
MKRLPRTLVTFAVLTGTLCIIFNDTHKQRALLWLPKWTAINDEVSFVTCDKNWKTFDTLLLQHVVMKVTVWSRARSTVLAWLLENINVGKRTAIVFPTISGGLNACLLDSLARRFPFFAADWVIFNDEDGTVAKVKRYFLYRGRYAACMVSRLSEWPKHKANRLSQKGAPAVLSRRCIPHKSGPRSTWTDALNGATFFSACLELRAPDNETTNSCANDHFRPILQALWHANATINFKVYVKDTDVYSDMFRGDMDMLLFPQIVPEDTMLVAFPAVLFYLHGNFYAYSGDGEQWVLSFAVLAQSQVTLAVLLLFGVVVWLTLSAAGCVTQGINFNWRVNWHVILHSATFTISTLLGNSAPTLFDGNRSRSVSTAIRIVLAVWALGTIPMKVYLCAILTSRLAVYVPPNPVDTLGELEALLDSGEMTPCVIENTAPHWWLTRNEPAASSLYQKLRAAFKRSPNVAGLTFGTFAECLERCASKPGFVCIYLSPSIWSESYDKNSVASREDLGLQLGSFPFRKDFPYLRAYRNFLLRMIETGLYPELKKHGTRDAAENPKERLADANGEVAEIRALKTSELQSIGSCFLALQFFALLVCFFEIALVCW